MVFCKVRFWVLFCSILSSFNSESFRFQSECGKMRTRKTPNTDTFHRVNTSYADDNTMYQPGSNVDDVINGLQVSAEKLVHWFTDNLMKGKTDKCHLIMSTNNAQETPGGESLIKTCTCEEHPGNHVNNFCKKGINKLSALPESHHI